MDRRQILAASTILSGGLALWGLAAQTGAAEVIDLGAGESDLRVQSGVLDFGKDVPRRKPARETDEGADDEGDAEIWLASASATGFSRGPRGNAEIEALVLDVGDDYLRHPGLKAAGLRARDIQPYPPERS
jgi:hypothetical protein